MNFYHPLLSATCASADLQGKSTCFYVFFCLQTNAAYLLFYQRQDKIRHPTLDPPENHVSSSSKDGQGGDMEIDWTAWLIFVHLYFCFCLFLPSCLPLDSLLISILSHSQVNEGGFCIISMSVLRNENLNFLPQPKSEGLSGWCRGIVGSQDFENVQELARLVCALIKLVCLGLLENLLNLYAWKQFNTAAVISFLCHAFHIFVLKSVELILVQI